MASMDLSETTRWLVQLVLTGAALLGAAWIYLDFAPRLQPQIAVVDRDNDRGLAVVRLTVHNTSRVMVHQARGGTRFHVVPVPLSALRGHSEFVPLTRDRYEQMDERDRLPEWEWRDPEPILTTTRYWYPGDSIAVDRMVAFPDQDCALHVALQVTGRVSLIVRLLLMLRRGSGRLLDRKTESWTTTLFVMPHEPNLP